MLGRARTAAKFLSIGLLVGVFFAPRSGQKSREQLLGALKTPLSKLRSRQR